MTLILLFVLVGTVWLLLPAAASSLYFDFSDLSVKPDESLELPCGVEGDFRHCVWETERGEVFQVEDVHAGLHPGMRASSNLTHNQCGIIVDALTERSFGKWTCRVYFAGLALRAERTVGKALECPGGFTQIGTECYYVYHGVKQNWEKSREFCQSLYSTSDLAVLNDCHQFELVWNQILADYENDWYWIGGTDQNQEGYWHWVNGEPVAMGTPFWRPGEPASGQSGGCLDLSTPYGYFNDVDCELEAYCVCQVLY